MFLKGTLILAASGMIVKIIGTLNWIFLSRILGGEGIGIYQMGFPIYLMGLTLSSAGVPVAISILTAEKIALSDYSGARRVFALARRLLFGTGVFFMLAIIFGAGWLLDSQIIRDGRVYWSLIALAPAVFIVTYMSSMRGYLQGWQQMSPTALSEIAEQLLRVAAMLLFAFLLLPCGLEYGAAGASMGAGVGALAAFFVLLFFVRRLNKAQSMKFALAESIAGESDLSIIKRIFRLALPIALSSVMLPLVANLDMIIVPWRLAAAGFNVHDATRLFGYLTGMAIPLVNLATLLTAALTVSLVPAIAQSRALGDKRAIIEKAATAFRIAIFVTMPAAVGLYLLAGPVARVVYNSPAAAEIIKITSGAVFFLGLHQVSTGMLQGLGFTKIPAASMIVAAAAKVFLNWQLAAVPRLGILGAGWATVADISLAALLNMFFIWRNTGYFLEIKRLARVLLATAAMSAAILPILRWGGDGGAWNLFLAFLAGAAVYISCALFLGALPAKDINQIPIFGEFYAKTRKKAAGKNCTEIDFQKKQGR
jgi:stage V sporulation protein B